MDTVESRLRELGVNLPVLGKPLANYLPWVRSGNLVFIAGQVPFVDGNLTVTGHLGAKVSVEVGQAQARICAINIISLLRDACEGNLDRVVRIVRVTGYVASTPDFADHPKVINGASDMFVAAFGELGRHSRAAVGVAALPLRAAVEVDAIAEIV